MFACHGQANQTSVGSKVTLPLTQNALTIVEVLLNLV